MCAIKLVTLTPASLELVLHDLRQQCPVYALAFSNRSSVANSTPTEANLFFAQRNVQKLICIFPMGTFEKVPIQLLDGAVQISCQHSQILINDRSRANTKWYSINRSPASNQGVV